MIVYKLGVRRDLSSLVVWSIIMGGLLAVAMAVFPAIGADTLIATVEGHMDATPQILIEIMGLGSIKILSSLVGYFAFAFQFILVFSMIFAGVLGARTLTTEEGCGATEFLLAQPITRGSIARQKLASAIVTFFIYTLIISAIAMVMAFVFRNGSIKEIAFDMLPALIGFFFCGLIYICIGFFFSSFLRSNGESIPIMVALVLITYILGLMGNIVSRVWYLVYASPIQYANPIILVQSGFNWIQVGIGAALILITILGGLNIYKKKNFYC